MRVWAVRRILCNDAIKECRLLVHYYHMFGPWLLTYARRSRDAVRKRKVKSSSHFSVGGTLKTRERISRGAQKIYSDGDIRGCTVLVCSRFNILCSIKNIFVISRTTNWQLVLYDYFSALTCNGGHCTRLPHRRRFAPWSELDLAGNPDYDEFEPANVADR